MPETTLTQECRDVVTEVCSETQVALQRQVLAHQPIIAAAPAVAQVYDSSKKSLLASKVT